MFDPLEKIGLQEWTKGGETSGISTAEILASRSAVHRHNLNQRADRFEFVKQKNVMEIQKIC